MMFKNENVLLIGISGITCGGKTTTATQLNKILPGSKIFSQDDYYFNEEDPRHIWIPELNHINFDVLSSLDMVQMHKDILDFIGNQRKPQLYHKAVKNFGNNGQPENLQKTIYKIIKQMKLTVVIVEGFSIFNYQPMAKLFDLKYYFLLEKEECRKRRETRVYEPPDCPGYFSDCVWPEHLKQKQEVINTVKGVTYFDEKSTNIIEQILMDIKSYLYY